jgi:UDP-glucose 4-epimerase
MKILITGQNSFVGKSFERWIKENQKNIEIDFVSIKNDEYKVINFSIYSAIIHLAALVHKSEKNISLSEYLSVNFDKTKDIFNKAIKEKVNQFIFMSSMAVFSNSKIINETTPIVPFTKYGISKKKAEDYLISNKKEIQLAIIRPPMIYGKNAPGNARIIENFSEKIFFFPSLKNKRSFVEINYLCNILFNVIDKKIKGIIHPSSKVMSTMDLFKYYRGNRKTFEICIFNPLFKLFLKCSIINKVFGDLYYDFDTKIIEF